MKDKRKVPGGALAYSKQLARGELGRSNKAPTEEHKRWASILRTGALGTAQLTDLPYLPSDLYDLTKRIRGKEVKESSHKRPSQLLQEAIDAKTKGELVPSTKLGKITDAVSRFGIEGASGAGILKGVANTTKAVPYAGKTASALSGFMKPTKAGAIGVGTGQAVVNENPNNPVAAMFASLMGGYGAAKTGKALKSIGNFTTQTKIRKSQGYQKGLEAEMSKRAGSERINELTENKVGEIVQEGVGNYLDSQKSHFELRKNQIDKSLNDVIKANPEINASVSLKEVTEPLLNGFKKLTSIAEKEAYLKTPAGKMMIRLYGLSPSTNSIQFQKSYSDFPLRFENPTVNLAESDNVIRAMNDATTTFGQIGSGPKQHLKKLATEIDDARLAAIERIDPKLHKEATKYKDDYDTYIQDKDLINNITEHAPKVNKRGVMTNEGDPSKVLDVVSADIGKGSKSLEQTGKMLNEQARNDTSLGIIHQLGKVDNKFDIKQFYDKFRGLSEHDQSKILGGLNKETRSTFDNALNQHRSYLDVRSNRNIVDRFLGAKSTHPDKLHLSPKHLAADMILSSSKEPSKRQLRKGMEFLDNNLASKNRSSLSKWTERIAEPKLMTRLGMEGPSFSSEQRMPSSEEDSYIQNYVSQMSDQELMGSPSSESEPDLQSYVASMSDAELGL